MENGWPPEALTPKPESVDVQINYGGGVQRQHLAKDEAADDGNAKGSPQLAALAYTDCQRKRAQHGCHGGHHDGPKTEQAGFVNRFQR